MSLPLLLSLKINKRKNDKGQKKKSMKLNYENYQKRKEREDRRLHISSGNFRIQGGKNNVCQCEL